ncbi:hypothetical protein [Flammeovirga aprica]|uniref:DUF2846 domain-containing protein n=1 Tax=Flammeovirga aprica JL-4 TaxID=694437 RepID=A0A7X9S091_9BACT|nr:hypothetical protein [Flammeovirga aprica]NME72018.1 hypothetical protein [Flammeovirga aprica JL-4]
MKTIHSLLIITAIIFLSSCNPKISTTVHRSYPPLDYKQEIVVMGLNQPEPSDSEILGQIKIGDTGFTTNCSYNTVIEKAKIEARKAGGNAIKIIDYIMPSPFGSSCHRITANILKVENIDNYSPVKKNEEVLDVDYAILNVYRYNGMGTMIGYDLYLGDSVICRVKNNYKTTIHIKKEGLNTIWAKTEKKSEVPINIEMGRTYYLKCSISMGIVAGRPNLELMDSKTGKMEFESFRAKHQ